MGSMSRKIQPVAWTEREFSPCFRKLERNLPLHDIDDLVKIMDVG
jgi:hypothetical protein